MPRPEKKPSISERIADAVLTSRDEKKLRKLEGRRSERLKQVHTRGGNEDQSIFTGTRQAKIFGHGYR